MAAIPRKRLQLHTDSYGKGDNMLRIRFATMILLLSVLFSPSLFAQSITGTISGTVHDQRGGMMAGVTVTARNTATGLQRQSASNDVGTFRIAALPVGLYNLTAEKPGFKTSPGQEPHTRGRSG